MKFEISNLCSHFWILQSLLHIFCAFPKCQYTVDSLQILLQGLLGWKLCDKGPFKYPKFHISVSFWKWLIWTSTCHVPFVYTMLHFMMPDWVLSSLFCLNISQVTGNTFDIVITTGLWKCCVYDVCYHLTYLHCSCLANW